MGALVEADDQVLQVGRVRSLDQVGQHDPPVHQLGEVGGVPRDLGQLAQHLVDLRRPLHRGQQVTEPAGDLHAEPVLAVRSPDEIPLVGQRPHQVVRRGQRDVAPVGDLLGVQPLRAVSDLFEDPERARHALDQIGRPPRQHLEPISCCDGLLRRTKPRLPPDLTWLSGADRPSRSVYEMSLIRGNDRTRIHSAGVCPFCALPPEVSAARGRPNG